MKKILLALVLFSFLKVRSQDTATNLEQQERIVLQQMQDSMVKRLNIEVVVTGFACPNCTMVSIHAWTHAGSFVQKKKKFLSKKYKYKYIFKKGRLAHFYIVDVIPWERYLEGSKPED